MVAAVAATAGATAAWSSAQPPDVTPVTAITTTTTTAPSVTVVTEPVTTTTTVAPMPIVGDEAAFMACIRWRESRGNYEAVNSTGTFRGAYQFYQPAWDSFAPEGWSGVAPDQAPPAIQDATALAAYKALGAAPWNGACQ